MTAGDFQFDQNTLVSDRSFSFRAWSFSLRELLLGMLAVGLLVTCIFLAGFLGKASSDLEQATPAALAAERACRGSSCMKTSAHIMALLNTSVDPCDNFYNFACGGYRVVNPTDIVSTFKSINGQMNERNSDQLMAILQSPSKRNMDWAAERKVKDFYKSCTNSLQREKLKGRPLIERVLPKLGGWYVKDGNSWNSDAFNLNSALQTVQRDLGVTAFFNFDISPGPFIWINRIGGTYMATRDYTNSPNERQTKLQQDYKNYMRTIAKLVARDAGISAATDANLNSRIEDFVSDVYDMETKLAQIVRSVQYQRTVASLNSLNGGTIDWVAFFRYYLNNAGVSESTMVTQAYPSYPANLTAMINSLDESSKNRRLNNYLVWRVLVSYVWDLSWDYESAGLLFRADNYGILSNSFSRVDRRCFSTARGLFRIALGALYIQSRFEAKNKDKVTEITDTLKTALEEMIQANTWMDQKTKDAAIEKMKSTNYLLGYPDFMADQETVDGYYSQLTINRTDHFGNVLAAEKHYWHLRVKLLGQRPNDPYTTNTVFYNTIGNFASRNTIYVMAGALQFPMYEYDMPHYASFGAIGSRLGHHMVHAVDQYGNIWLKGGKYNRKGWWSEQTKQNYRKSQVCVGNLYGNLTQGPYTTDNGDPVTVSVRSARIYAADAIASISGVQTAYKAYQMWQEKKGQDPISAGLPYTPQQLFFIAHAQTMCHNLDPNNMYRMAQSGYVHKDTRLNVALMEMPEFRESFQCKVGDKMVSPKPCTYL